MASPRKKRLLRLWAAERERAANTNTSEEKVVEKVVEKVRTVTGRTTRKTKK
tara:strand:+ start:396 stop:551 length:156 start_codon:yes stop_codon:yes gene_type:complete